MGTPETPAETQVSNADRTGASLGDPAWRGTARFVAVTDPSDLDLAWLRSFAEPVVLFNYDPG